jgi:SAM-dependent methyltransferase
MNRKQRRATQRSQPASADGLQRTKQPEPTSSQAHNELGCRLLLEGRLDEAAAHFAQALTLMPDLLEQQYANIVATLLDVNPRIRAGVARVAEAWPQEVRAEDILEPSGIGAIARDPMLRCMLESATVRHIDLERYLTAVRRIMLSNAVKVTRSGDAVKHTVLGFCCTLAKQCFINEYIFAMSAEESEQVEGLTAALSHALATRRPIPPILLSAVAAYVPLSRVDESRLLLARAWPEPVRQVLTQQLTEPDEEKRFREIIPRLTRVENYVSMLVKQQYEENPYPRWVHAANVGTPVTVNEHLCQQFPSASFRPLGKKDGVINILVAGCGTGRHPIEVAEKYLDARILAVDLSLASLCYARRKTPPALADKLEYAQADILELPSVGRTFDLIDASGVLHHLSDPFAGWRALLSLLRPGGFMRVGLYSELARRHIVAARAFIAQQGFQPTPEDIRRCRQELLRSPFKEVAMASDFFTTSECRDLLFHVQETRTTIPQIESFIAENGLQFIGFEFAPQVQQRYENIFGNFGRDLQRWHSFELQNPDAFSGMYQFAVQKG